MRALLPTETSAITAPEWSPFVAEVEGRFEEASNATLLGTTREGERVIYKPVAGVRPLWDFEASTLPAREVWTYRIALELGIDAVPETVLADGEYGPGAVQRFIEAFADESVVTLINGSDASLWPIAVLDVVTNNADRKAGHILRDDAGGLWAIDHGLTFHPDPKLRTILWGFAGMAIPEELVARLQELGAALDSDLGTQFAAEFGVPELAALRLRVSELVESGVHPDPPEDRPAIPWPPY